MIKTIIIDDEPGCIENARKLLQKYSDISLLAEVNCADEAFKAIKQLHPDLIFLDVKMPQKSGFDLLDELIEDGLRNFDVIFMTAFEEFAIDAIRYAAFDYLLKPMDNDALEKALNRFRNKAADSIGEKADTLKRYIDSKEKLKFTGNKGVVLFYKPEDILWIEADKAYSKLWLCNGEMQLISKNIGQLENFLSEYGFVRVHKSYLINKRYIASYIKSDRLIILKQLDKEFKIPVATRFDLKQL